MPSLRRPEAGPLVLGLAGNRSQLLPTRQFLTCLGVSCLNWTIGFLPLCPAVPSEERGNDVGGVDGANDARGNRLP